MNKKFILTYRAFRVIIVIMIIIIIHFIYGAHHMK